MLGRGANAEMDHRAWAEFAILQRQVEQLVLMVLFLHTIHADLRVINSLPFFIGGWESVRIQFLPLLEEMGKYLRLKPLWV